MFDIAFDRPHDFNSFRDAARRLIAAGLPPHEVMWHDGVQDGLFTTTPYVPPGQALTVPAQFVSLAEDVICHRADERLSLLYDLLWRITHGERHLLGIAADPLVHRLSLMQKAIRRDVHKMHAFVRFRRVVTDTGERFVSWFEPEHFISRHAAPFFADRFAAMEWAILTPVGSVHWDGSQLTFGKPVRREDALAEDQLEDWWRTYYRATFNPTRANPELMRAEMPKRYWRNLPEAKDIPTLLSQAPARATAMLRSGPTSPRKRIPPPARPVRPPEISSFDRLASEAAACRRCPLFATATQTVFGTGPQSARIVLVGEQPGDHEDLAGEAFVGPAGQLLNRALEAAGIERSSVYITNAVKHFKFDPRGKRRLHKKPEQQEVEACKWWLKQELALIRPDVVVALGATAARTLLERDVAILRERGGILEHPEGFRVLLTVHPSFMLRLPDSHTQEWELARFVRDLQLARTISIVSPQVRS